MAVQEKIYTIADLLELPYQPQEGRIPKLYELVRGQLRTMSPASGLHGVYGADFLFYVTAFVKQSKLGFVTAAGTGYILAVDPERDTVRAPDVGFVAKDRLPQGLPEKGYVPVAPDLAIEIVSPSESADDIEEKIQNYLQAGTRLILYFYPKTRTLHVITASGTIRLNENDTLDGGDVLPGFSLPLKLLFEQP